MLLQFNHRISALCYRIRNAKNQKEVLIPCFNKKFPCPFLNKEELCDIHKIRPTDCRLFPFDIIKINNKFVWIIWEINCPITKYTNFEAPLIKMEEELIPEFKEHLEDYSKFRLDDFFKKYSFKIIRKVNLK